MSEKKLFIRQTKCPDKGDKWYTLKKSGGYSPCIAGKPVAWVGSALANCVGYCWGRFAYLEGNKDCRVGCAVGNDYPNDAWVWYRNSIAQGYEVGQKPRLGAVAVWSRTGSKGHVAMVEHVNKDNTWESSESGYNTSPVWFTKKYDSKSSRSGYKFLGFIYPKYEFVEELDELKVGDKVRIIGTGNSNSYGTGRIAGGIGYRRYIKAIYKDRKYPYRVGTTFATTGYYKKEALKKI